MKKILLFVLMIAVSVTLSAQEYVTTFMGIPVDGTKKEMVKKLKKIGFKPNKMYSKDFLNGEFNGRDVRVYIVTNKDKVYRIMVADEKWTNEISIKNEFNRLYDQFSYSKRYVKDPSFSKIPDNEDVEYEISVNKKDYEASFYQMPETSSSDSNYFESLFNNLVWFKILEVSGKYSIVIYYDNESNKADGGDL